MAFLLALDQGTTSSRAILFDEAGNLAGCGQKELTQIYPKPGWVEHDPGEIWETTLDAIAGAYKAAGATAADVAAIGITNQRETTMIWYPHDREPLHNAIVW